MRSSQPFMRRLAGVGQLYLEPKLTEAGLQGSCDDRFAVYQEN